MQVKSISAIVCLKNEFLKNVFFVFYLQLQNLSSSTDYSGKEILQRWTLYCSPRIPKGFGKYFQQQKKESSGPPPPPPQQKKVDPPPSKSGAPPPPKTDQQKPSHTPFKIDFKFNFEEQK